MKWGKHPGRIRERIAALLAEKGLIVSPYDLWVQEGGYRHRHWDLARWGTNHARWKDSRDPDGNERKHDVHVSSWSTMTECVRWGIEIGKFDGSWNHVSAEHARQPGQEAKR